MSGQDSQKRMNVSPSDLVLRDNMPHNTPQRMALLLRSKEQALNVSNFIFEDSPDINGFTDHEKAGQRGSSKSKLDMKQEETPKIGTPSLIKNDISTQENPEYESQSFQRKVLPQRSSKRVAQQLLLRSQEQKTNSDQNTGSAFSKFKRRKLSNER